MSIVLNEYDWAEKMIDHHDIGKKPIETLSRISKYYLANHYDRKEIRKKLEEFLIQCDPSVSLPQWDDALSRVVKNADRYPLIVLDGVDISDKEMMRIERLDGRQIKRLAFTLLCAAKYWDAVYPQNNHWVNCQDRDVMRMANINTSIRRQSTMFAILRDEGMIRFSRKIDNINVQVSFIEDGETELHIHDFRNLGYQYMKHYGGPYFECVNCGIVVKEREPSRGRKPKYCPNCAIELHTQQMVDAVMRRRRALKN